MVRLSEKKLKKDIFLRIIDQLIDAVSRAGTKSEAKMLLKDLLGPEEKIMLAKRLAIVFMLERGYSFFAVGRTLKVSQTTVARIWKRIKNGDIFYTLNKIREEKKKERFWRNLESALRFGLPPIVGPDRWSGVLNPRHYRGRTDGI